MAGAPRAWGSLEERPGCAGALRTLGGLGGHLGAPHITDMEGPAVKRFVTAPSISSSMSRSGHFSGGPERFPEDADHG